MPESTLRKILKNETVSTSLDRYRCTFTPQMELEFLDYVHTLDAIPYPKSSVMRTYNKRSKRSEILSSSPQKRTLEEEAMKKNQKPILKKKKEKPRKPKIAPKKKVSACPGCSEIYREPIVED